MVHTAIKLSAAFTLAETLIVLSLMALIMQLSITEGIDSYDRSQSRADRTLLIGALRKARAESMNDVCANTDSICGATPIDHGVFVSENGLTIFEGPSYANRDTAGDESYSFSSDIQLATSSSDEVTFATDTGDVSSGSSTDVTASSISIIGADNRTETIQINSQGAILSSTLASSV
jgi:Tfp pilus assembly protein FimT